MLTYKEPCNTYITNTNNIFDRERRLAPLEWKFATTRSTIY